MIGLGGFESFANLGSVVSPRLALCVVLALAWTFWASNTWEYQPRFTVRNARVTAALFMACVLTLATKSPFLYFQF